MKKIFFIMVLQLAHILHAATNTDTVESTDLRLITAVSSIRYSCVSLGIIDESFPNTKDAMNDFCKKISDRRNSISATIAALPNETMKRRALDFFEGIVKQVIYAYADLFSEASRLAPKQAALTLEFGGDSSETSYIALPHPLSTSSVKKGQEQATCDLAKELLNLHADYQKAKALLVGVRTINANQLMMFLTGARQVVANGQITAANQFVQDLYAAYANPDSDLASIYRLEALAAPHLLGDNERITLTYYHALTYNPNKEYAYYPDVVNHEEVLDKPAMLKILSERTGNLTPQQKATIKLLADQLEFSKIKTDEQKRFFESEQVSRNKLLGTENAASTVMFASFSEEVERIKTALAEAAALRVQARNALLASENNEKWQIIERELGNIQTHIREKKQTPAGWKFNELIMDYGSEERSSITREMRTDVEKVLNNQLTILGITGVDIMHEQKIMPNIAGTLLQWFGTQELGFSPAEKQTAQEVLNAMVRSAPADIANNTHLQFLASIYKLYRLSEFYQQWPNVNERKSFLEQLKVTIHQAFQQVLEHKGYPLKCATGARGRAFLLNIGIIGFMRDQHK
jgi:hypothetical protein